MIEDGAIRRSATIKKLLVVGDFFVCWLVLLLGADWVLLLNMGN